MFHIEFTRRVLHIQLIVLPGVIVNKAFDLTKMNMPLQTGDQREQNQRNEYYRQQSNRAILSNMRATLAHGHIIQCMLEQSVLGSD